MELPDTAQSAPNTDEIAFVRDGAVARLILNRPRAINALTLPMVEGISALLTAWEAQDAVQTVTIEGAGERGLCAGWRCRGGASRSAQRRRARRVLPRRVRHERSARAYSKPVVAYMDGIVMGGGVGVSSFASHRLVTERSKIAMPETIIGFFPDVGVMYLLSRSPGETGTHRPTLPRRPASAALT